MSDERSDLAVLLAGGAETAEAADPAPWFADVNSSYGDDAGFGTWIFSGRSVIAKLRNDLDAELIDTMRSAFPAAVKAVQNVLALHKADEDGDCEGCAAECMWCES